MRGRILFLTKIKAAIYGCIATGILNRGFRWNKYILLGIVIIEKLCLLAFVPVF